jgi:hypothetical protein
MAIEIKDGDQDLEWGSRLRMRIEIEGGVKRKGKSVETHKGTILIRGTCTNHHHHHHPFHLRIPFSH